MVTKTTQTERLLAALSDKKTHTVPELLRTVYGVRGPASARIGSRIHELRSIHGWNIKTERVAGTVWSYQLIGRSLRRDKRGKRS